MHWKDSVMNISTASVCKISLLLIYFTNWGGLQFYLSFAGSWMVWTVLFWTMPLFLVACINSLFCGFLCGPELGLVSLSDKERTEKVEDIVKVVSQRGFPLFLTSIERVSIHCVFFLQVLVFKFLVDNFCKWCKQRERERGRQTDRQTDTLRDTESVRYKVKKTNTFTVLLHSQYALIHLWWYLTGMRLQPIVWNQIF